MLRLRAQNSPMAQELFDLGDGIAVACNPGGRFHGWLFKKHPDGQYVSIGKLPVIANPFGNLGWMFDGIKTAEYNGGDTPPV